MKKTRQKINNTDERFATVVNNGNISQRNSNNNSKKIGITNTSIGIWSGPIPPPEALERYNQIDSTFADRILAMTEKEVKHRHFSEYIGQATSFIVAVCGLFTVAYLGLNGKQWLGAGVGLTVFGSIVASFMFTVKSAKQKNHNK